MDQVKLYELKQRAKSAFGITDVQLKKKTKTCYLQRMIL